MIYDEFPHEITFQKLESIPDGGGGYDEKYVDYLTIHGFVCGISSREFYQAQQLQNPVNCNVYYPYRTDIDQTMRIIYANQILTLKSAPIDQGGMHKIMNLKCEITGVLDKNGGS
ncbi:phage head closure protein [Bacillus sp. CLL-7-23]|uniref:Phage head closure protein n=1 Tax=Bacillus changyiensis TaxID=3004103 RepID=A0ABT4X851_9BACI|nr:phage head closure protein [Bacillus changyiensis]MDA7028458.1 phage head closure protein [Bacillus changyiensis]